MHTGIQLRALTAQDNSAITAIIRQVLTEFGANREGFAYVDAELGSLADHFAAPAAAYQIVERSGKLLGGAGFGPLLGGDPEVAELKKMYLLPEARGLGLGRQLLDRLLPMAQAAGYHQLYLETTGTMIDAMKLYEKAGFKRLQQPMGATGHFGCQIWYMRSLLA